MKEINDGVEGVGRLPIIDPDEVKRAIEAKFPNIPGWFVQFAEVATSLLDISQHDLIGHSEIQSCQLQPLGYGSHCGRDSDFILVNVVMEKDNQDNASPSNSRVRYYCAPCVYTTMCRAIQAVSKADKLETVIEEGMADSSAKILQERLEFIEDSIERAAEVVENKYSSDGDKLIEELNKKFEGHG